ncbi:putative 15-hydroxyprostaglandin dehydrogenase (nad(+)) protein [Lasiodiplodia theobromae]|uniref:Cis-2,3-dihydrobiphenyl-2,3-diol dehydrogenase n=1 Tax=Lasiodiplodia theobromae TaxID=45133 RepID=A0A5N5DB08_9PEZI|nr:15-hydroxyprostaglandin dehydrogenase [Lasiodiplodia theobromae]KAB2574797.1 Cis-2,3-dihydrobiphenyl-2,3-diol dehydrogenase [Lasiodiplodia theobromae]KAF4545757.1 15-hydroxyprostaglandin dehydrogenase [Lasiodiplodia theobromae]KAF9636303.1 putative 15-hydroxyprostaglandin dehydrogenase (nad(+)) protein [Lasiodiplodia theobromae]
MSNPVAIITGASSGIGLGLTQHLLSKSWDVVLLDLNPPPASASLPADRHLFIRTDVSSWLSQSAAFARAHAWRQRLDFAALNAGIDDRDTIFPALPSSITASSPPPTEPDTTTFAVNLLGVYGGIKLFAHYASIPLPSTNNHPRPTPTIIVTSSAAGLYPLPAVPQYTATKHALVGLVRALAPGAAERGFAINAICPDMVPSNLAPPGLMEAYPESGKTPMATMMRAFDELLGLSAGAGAGAGDEGLSGVLAAMRPQNGKVVEAVVRDVLYRDPPQPNAKQGSVGPEVAALWDRVYRERNIRFARLAEERARKRMAEAGEGRGGGRESKL